MWTERLSTGMGSPMGGASLRVAVATMLAIASPYVAAQPLTKKVDRDCRCSSEPCMFFSESAQRIRGVLASGTQGYVINLFSPICFKGSGRRPPEEGEDIDWPLEVVLQVAITGKSGTEMEALQAKIKQYMGRPVILTGSPFVGHTAWHHTTILWATTSIELDK